MEVKPLAGRPHIAVTERLTRKDWAQQIKQMLDERYPDAIKVRLVYGQPEYAQHPLYEAFEPCEAMSVAKSLDIIQNHEWYMVLLANRRSYGNGGRFPGGCG